MKDAHLKAEDVDPLLWEESEVRNRLILHHLAVCSECYAVAGFILDLYVAGEVDLRLGQVDLTVGRSRMEAPALWKKLSKHSFKRQMALVRDTSRFDSWGLCELLCGESEKDASRDPLRSRELAELAVEVAAKIDEWEVAEPHWLHELRAYALAHLANAQRVLGELQKSAETFAEADKWWGPAIGDVGNILDYEAKYLALKASLRRAERRLPEALGLLEKALEADPDPALRPRIAVSMAKIYEEQGRMSKALDTIVEARESAEEPDERLRLCFAQNHLDYLSKAERYIEAQDLLAETEQAVADLGSDIDRLRFRWTRARIANGLGRAAAAAEELEDVREKFAELLPYDAALASLELGLMYSRLARLDKVLSVTEDALALLRELKVEREGLMAIRVLAQAVKDRDVTAELLSQALTYLQLSTEQASHA